MEDEIPRAMKKLAYVSRLQRKVLDLYRTAGDLMRNSIESSEKYSAFLYDLIVVISQKEFKLI